MKSIHTEIEINAPVEKVWSILTDFKTFPEWNPFVRSITGNVQVGSSFKVVLQQPGGSSMTFRPKCLVFQKNEEFRWLGHLLFPGIFDGEHIFKLKSLSEKKTKFVQSENFKGVLVPLFWKQLNTKTLRGFEEMNRAIKTTSSTTTPVGKPSHCGSVKRPM